MTEAGYRSSQVCRALGVTYRQLDYWDRTDLLTPSLQAARGSGSMRLYSFDDACLVALVVAMLAHNFSIKRIRQALATVRVAPTAMFLVSDGLTIKPLYNADSLLEHLSAPLSWVLSVPLVISQTRLALAA